METKRELKWRKWEHWELKAVRMYGATAWKVYGPYQDPKKTIWVSAWNKWSLWRTMHNVPNLKGRAIPLS